VGVGAGITCTGNPECNKWSDNALNKPGFKIGGSKIVPVRHVRGAKRANETGLPDVPALH